MARVGGRAIAIGVAGLLALAPAAAAQSSVQDPPKVPSSTKGAKRCRSVRNRFGGDFRVYITKGASRVSCRKARSVVRRGPDPRGWTYFDWSKAGGGPGPWSDVWEREDERAVVAGILRG